MATSACARPANECWNAHGDHLQGCRASQCLHTVCGPTPWTLGGAISRARACELRQAFGQPETASGRSPAARKERHCFRGREWTRLRAQRSSKTARSVKRERGRSHSTNLILAHQQALNFRESSSSLTRSAILLDDTYRASQRADAFTRRGMLTRKQHPLRSPAPTALQQPCAPRPPSLASSSRSA